jgi:hypothetical protein
LDERLNDYYANPDNTTDFDKTIDEIERGLWVTGLWTVPPL